MLKKAGPALKTALLLLIGLMVIAGFVIFDPDVKNIGDVVAQMEPGWFLLALGCMFAFYALDALLYVRVGRDMGVKMSYWDSLIITQIGFFYSAITPMSTGGQPFQLIEMKKRGIKVGAGTSVLMVRSLAWHICLTSVGLVSFAFVAGQLWAQSVTLFLMFIVGVISHLTCIGVVVLLMIRPEWMRSKGDRWARRLARRLFKTRPEKQESMSAAWQGFVNDYICAVDYVKNHSRGMVWALVLAAAQVAAYMSVTYFVYLAMGFVQEGYLTLMAYQSILFIAVAFIPLPGASGASETGFYVLFTRFFGAARLAGMLAWRILTYYMTILLGIIAVMISGMRRSKEAEKTHVSD